MENKKTKDLQIRWGYYGDKEADIVIHGYEACCISMGDFGYGDKFRARFHQGGPTWHFKKMEEVRWFLKELRTLSPMQAKIMFQEQPMYSIWNPPEKRADVLDFSK